MTAVVGHAALEKGPSGGTAGWLAPDAALPHLFDKFVRGVEGDGRPPGTGLGLAIAKGFLTAQGGAIHAYNRTDRSGVCVRVFLPAGEA